LAKTSILIGKNCGLEIECRQGRSGQKTINISMAIVGMNLGCQQITIKFQPKLRTTIHANLPKIRVPQEAYKFLGAMDGLIGQLPAEAAEIPTGLQKKRNDSQLSFSEKHFSTTDFGMSNG
jgi:hypothetical protein